MNKVEHMKVDFDLKIDIYSEKFHFFQVDIIFINKQEKYFKILTKSLILVMTVFIS